MASDKGWTKKAYGMKQRQYDLLILELMSVMQWAQALGVSRESFLRMAQDPQSWLRHKHAVIPEKLQYEAYLLRMGPRCRGYDVVDLFTTQRFHKIIRSSNWNKKNIRRQERAERALDQLERMCAQRGGRRRAGKEVRHG